MANHSPSKKTTLPANKERNNKRGNKAKSSFHVLTPDEMAAKEKINGIGKEPSKYGIYRKRSAELYIISKKEPSIEISRELMDRQKGLWRIGLQSPDGRLYPNMPVVREELIDRKKIVRGERYAETKFYRPRWADVEYLPKLVPHRNPISRRIKDLIRYRDYQGMRFLDYDAQEALTMSYPWRCIGKIFTGDNNGPGMVGTGVLVGPNLMMTASHMWRWGAPGRWMRFSPGFREGDQHPDSYVTRIRGIQGDGDTTGFDYIICQLQKPLGEMLGWMGSQSFGDEDDYYDNRWISVGYPTVFYSGNRPQVNFDVEVEDIDNDDPGLEIETDYDVGFGGGWSGGPLWGVINNDFKIIGVKSGYEADGWDSVRSVFSGGNLMVELIKHGLANFK